jgi:hypothetical protein
MTEEEKIATMNAALVNHPDRFDVEYMFRAGTTRSRAFISYCQADAAIATRLHSDLSVRGCTVWQFETSAVPGSDAWDVAQISLANGEVIQSCFFCSSRCSDLSCKRSLRKRRPLAENVVLLEAPNFGAREVSG